MYSLTMLSPQSTSGRKGKQHAEFQKNEKTESTHVHMRSTASPLSIPPIPALLPKRLPPSALPTLPLSYATPYPRGPLLLSGWPCSQPGGFDWTQHVRGTYSSAHRTQN